MVEICNTYEDHTIIYKLVTFFAALFFPCIVIEIIQPRFLTTSLVNYFIIIWALSFLAILSALLIGSSSSILTYKKDGEIIFTEHSINVGCINYTLNELAKIEIRAKAFKGKSSKLGVFDGTGNRIKIYKQSGEIIDKHFVIISKDQLNNLKEILNRWKDREFKIIQTYFI